MHVRPMLAAAGCFAVVLAACSGSGGGASITVPAAVTFATASSTTVVASLPATSRATTTTSLPASTTSSSTTTSSTAASSTTTSPTVVATTTAVPTTAATGAFTPVAAPSVPEVTHAIDAAWVDPATQQLLTVEDGSYWGNVTGQGTGDGGVEFVTIRFAQAFFGGACTAQFGDDSCDNDIGTLETPSGTMPLHVGAVRTTVSDPSTQQSYEVGSDVLFALIANPTAPPAEAPAGYVYAPFAFLVQVHGGQIVSAEQVWTP